MLSRGCRGAVPACPRARGRGRGAVQQSLHEARRDAGKAEIIGLRIDQEFNAEDHQKILNAIVVWKYVLTATSGSRSTGPPSACPRPGPRKRRKGFGLDHSERHHRQNEIRSPASEVAAETVTLPDGGGMVIVSPDVSRMSNLENVVLHELGHVLGLNHDPAAV